MHAVLAGRGLIRAAIEAHGADRLADRQVDFRFRGTPYRMTRDDGRFVYERWVETDGGRRHERLDNDGFAATVDGTPEPLGDAQAAARGRSVNSVVYFASLPYSLEDPAVQPLSLGAHPVGGEIYDRVEVRFAEPGGGADHDDVFVYWFDPKTNRLAFLAYAFHTGRGGVRFRVATGEVEAGGVRFVQWDNYGLDGDPEDLPKLTELPALWQTDDLPLLSSIVLEDVRVTR